MDATGFFASRNRCNGFSPLAKFSSDENWKIIGKKLNSPDRLQPNWLVESLAKCTKSLEYYKKTPFYLRMMQMKFDLKEKNI